MSVLVHLCRTCDHQSAWHEGGNGGYTPCRCCRAGTSDPDPVPTLLPTTSSPHGIPEELWQPGTQRNAGTMHASRTCACAACREAAEGMAAGITRREHPLAAPRLVGLSGR